ncbi:exported hypothetical protein [Mesorhizobium metallidurans STM 2683]|uniref:Uncharacterized protein n=1 Tax=Mesorhizobium metallidurans STM 2683 TaxID=1297569 RepID=M5EW43_9HYPH|nr:exported hypothetical protein [Mesorhizobium metallidurans STM 2683]
MTGRRKLAATLVPLFAALIIGETVDDAGRQVRGSANLKRLACPSGDAALAGRQNTCADRFWSLRCRCVFVHA